MANPWDNDPIVAAGGRGAGAPAMPWASDPILDRAQAGVVSSFETGLEMRAQSRGVSQAAAYQRRLGIFDELDKLPLAEAAKRADVYAEPEIKRYAVLPPEKKAELRAQYQEFISAGQKSAAEATQRLGTAPRDTTLEALSKAPLSEWPGLLWDDPMVIVRLGAMSAPQMAEGLAMAPVLGPGGLGIGSMGTEFAASLSDSLREAGVDMTNAEAIRAAMANPELMARAREKAKGRGVAIGALDTLTAGIAGRALLPARAMERLPGKAGEMGLQAGVQSAGGAAGEAAAQVVTEGRVTSPQQVGLEAIGEFATAPIEVGALGVQAGKYRRSGDVGGAIPGEELTSLLAGTGEEVRVPAETVDLTSMTPSERPLTLGPEQELPPESQFQTALPLRRPAEAQQATQDFFARSGAVPGGDVRGRAAYDPDAVYAREIPARDAGGGVSATPGGQPAPNPAVDALRASAARETASIKERLSTLPPIGQIRLGAEGVTGNAKAVGLARRAAIAWGNAARVRVEGNNPEAEREYRATAARLMEKATEAGFRYTSPIQRMEDGLWTQAASEVGARSAGMQLGKGAEVTQFPANRTRKTDSLTPRMDAAQRRVDSTLRYELESIPTGEKFAALPEFARRILTEAKHMYTTAINAARGGDIQRAGNYLRMAETRLETAKAAGYRPPELPTAIFGSGGESVGARNPFVQNPKFFENPLVYLEARLGNKLLQVGPNVWTTGERDQYTDVLGFVRQITRKLLPDLKLILDFRPDGPFAIPGAEGSYTGFKGDYGLLWLSPNMIERGYAPAVVAHELGHAIVHQHWSHTDGATQQAVYAAFARHVERIPGSTAQAFMTDLHNPFSLFAVEATYNARLEQKALDFIKESHYTRWWSFDEWIAEQASRWMFTSRTPRTLLDRFFSGLANTLEWLFRRLGRGPEYFQPEAEVRKWLDDLMLRRAEGLGPLTGPGTLDAFRREVLANAKALGETPGLTVGGHQAENMNLRQLEMRGLGIGRKAQAQTDRWGWMAKVGTHLLQIAANNPHITGLRNYVEATRAWNQTKMGLVSKSVGRLHEWRGLGKESARNLGEFLYALDAMEYLPAGSNIRWPTTGELVALAQKYKLDRRAIGVYSNIKNDFLDILNRVEAAAIKHARQTLTNPTALANKLAELQAEMGALRARPYFPHARFGDWTVTVRDSKGAVVYHAARESERAANAHEKEVRAAYPGMEVTGGKLPEDLRIFQGVPPTLLKTIQNTMNLTRAQQKALEGLIFDLSPQNAAVKRFKQRKGIAGFSMDAQRSYADYFQHIAGHVARLDHAIDLQNAIDEVETSARAMRGSFIARDVGKRQGIADWMKAHYAYIMNPTHEWQAVKSAIFHVHLGFNVSSALVNLTQLAMTTYPYLGARFGDVRAMASMQKATLDLRKMFFFMDPKGMATDEVEAFQLGKEQLFLEEGQAVELAGLARSGAMDRFIPGTGVQRGLLAVGRASAMLFQQVERINRHVTFLSAYRLAKKDPNSKHMQEILAANPKGYQELLGKGWTPTNAAAFLAARDAVDRTQFEYAAYARPEALRGRKGALFAFWMFRQNYLWFLKNDPGAGRALVVLLAMAGLAGLPFADDAAALARFFASQMGKNFDPMVEARRWMGEIVGKENADILMHGMARDSFGLPWVADMTGVPLPSLDISNRIGMGNVIPGLPAALDPTSDGPNKIANVAQQALGAGFGVPLTMLKALESNDPDVFKMWERLLPAAARNLGKAVAMAKDQVTNSAGARIVKYDVTDAKTRAEVVAQALGFAPTATSRGWDAYIAQQEAVKFWAIQRGSLLDEFALAHRAKDREALADARADIKEFNASIPDKRLRISADTLRKSLKARARRRREVEAGGVGQKMYEGVGRTAREPFPTP